jgi:DNA-binding transcriptional ArsR family regulator
VTDPLDSVFSALSDPTRRQIVQRLVRRGPATATDLATAFPMSRQAIAKHLQVLDEAGVVDRRRDGREVRYGVVSGGLVHAQRWLATTDAAWQRRLERLRSRVEERP